MTPAQIQDVKTSFQLIAGDVDSSAELFYGKLFELDPTLRPLFGGDMKSQGRKLMQMIAAAVNALDRLETIVPAVQGLGERHVRYGVKAAHYDTVGQALLWTLARGLGPRFTAETRSAWTEVYTLLSNTMKAAAQAASSLTPVQTPPP